jgi:hypothetical protein
MERNDLDWLQESERWAVDRIANPTYAEPLDALANRP